MKALLVNGSPHKAGNTATALAEVAKALEGEGVAAETFWIGTQPVRGCAACGACKREGGGGKCAFDDDACNELIGRLRGADAVMDFAFGVVALVAMTPLITIQALGFRSILSRFVREKAAIRRILSADDAQIIYFK